MFYALFGLMAFLWMFLHACMVLVLWKVGDILENGYGILGQNYVALLQGSGMAARFHSRNLILGI